MTHIFLSIIIYTILYKWGALWVFYLFVFSPENCIGLYYACYLFSNRINYVLLSPPSLIVLPSTNFELIIEFFKLRGYLKLYYILQRKRGPKLVLCFHFCLWLMGIPVRFLTLIWRFCWNGGKTFREKLKILYYRTRNLCEDTKIEILNGSIYLNCHTPAKFFRGLHKAGIRDAQIAHNMFYAFQKELIKFDQIEKKDQTYITFTLSKFQSEKKLFSPLYPPGFHYSYIYNPPFSQTLKGPVAMHGTSNIQFFATSNQIKEGPIPRLILPNAPDPGTVITPNPPTLITLPKQIDVPTYQVDGIMYFYPQFFYLGSTAFAYQSLKHSTYSSIWSSYIGSATNPNQRLMGDLSRGVYNDDLLLTSEATLSTYERGAEFNQFFH